MNLDTARTVLIEDFLDTVLGDGVGMLSQSAVNRYINEAQVEACKRWDVIIDISTAAVCQLTLASGTRGYPIHGKITRVHRAEYYNAGTGKRVVLEQYPYDQIERTYGTQWRTNTGQPFAFAIKGRAMYLYPTPGANEDGAVVNMEVARLPLVDMVDDDDEFEAPEQYQQDLLHWAAYRARSRRDNELGDPQGAGFHLQNFERVFGVPVSAQVLISQLENPTHTTFTVRR